VIPAQAGAHFDIKQWIPAFAGIEKGKEYGK
jgi:hypothetical protein